MAAGAVTRAQPKSRTREPGLGPEIMNHDLISDNTGVVASTLGYLRM